MKNEVTSSARMLCVLCFCMFTMLMQLNLQIAGASPAPDQLPGWPIQLTNALRISDIIVSDIDGDGKDELLIGIENRVHIINESGDDLPGWPQEAGDSWHREVEVVAVGDIDGDGDKEIVGAGEGGIYAWHWETGNLVDGWPLLALTVWGSSTSGDMVLGNVDGDPSDLEIVIAALDNKYLGANSFDIHVLDHNGFNIAGWPQSFDVDSIGHVYLSCGDIDNNGNDEIIAACHRTRYYQSAVYVFHSDGQIATGWPIQGNGPFVSPAVLCNLDGDEDIEIVAATVNGNQTGQIYAWNPDGTSVSGWPALYNAFHLAVGDLNSDDRPEIIASYSNSTYGADHLAVIDRHGTELLSKTLELRNPATVGNADNDTDSEIIIPSHYGNLYVMDVDGEDLSGFPIHITNYISGRQPAMGDMDGDGDIELLQLDGGVIHAFDLNVPKSERPDWPMVRHDERRSSLWTPPQTAGINILEITGPLEVMEDSSTHYTAWTYFENGSDEDVTLEADWTVDPRYAEYGHFDPDGVLVTHDVPFFKDIIIYAEYVEDDFAQLASYNVRIRPTVQVLYVDDDSVNDPGPNDPSISDPDENGTEQHPFDTVQEAIDVAGSGYGDKVIVLPGTYNEIVDCVGKDFTLTSTNPDDPEIVATTIITNQGLDGYTIGEPDGSLLGLTIIGGIITGNSDILTAYSPTISHCNIRSKGIAINIKVPYQQGPVNVTIENNIISVEGGICIYMFAQAFANGGMNGVIRNNILTGNSHGTGIVYRMHKSMPVITNNIICGFKYGIHLTYTSRLEERTALIYYNNLYDNQENYHISSPPTPLDLTGVNGNISVDPLFVDYENGDFHLRSDSPCINAGDPDYMPEPGETDLDGKARLIGGRIDMGAYEFNHVPIADAGPDQIAYAWIDGIAEIVLGGSNSYDPDGDQLTYSWSWEVDNKIFEANGVSPAIELPAGLHSIELVVSDGFDGASDEVVVDVVGAIETGVRVMPRVINVKSRGREVLALVQLPEGISASDIDEGYGVVFEPVAFDARLWRVLGRKDSCRLIAMFDREKVINALSDQGGEVSIVFRLLSGRYVFGSDRLKVLDAGKGKDKDSKRVPKHNGRGRERESPRLKDRS